MVTTGLLLPLQHRYLSLEGTGLMKTLHLGVSASVSVSENCLVVGLGLNSQLLQAGASL